MSYCGGLDQSNQWISSWTYNKLYENRFKFISEATSNLQTSAISDDLLISGLVYTDDTVTLNPSWTIASDPATNTSSTGTDYCLETQNSLSVELSTHCFDLDFLDYEEMEATNVDSFSILLPYPAGVARIVLKKGTKELAVQLVSSNSPQVTVLSPNGGETWPGTGMETISWAGNDTDGDSLTYSVFYSHDGSSWIPVGNSITETQITVDVANLPGGNNAKVRVLATDGVNTSSDESNAFFTVGTKAPQAFILSPNENITVPSESPLYFQGTAFDFEDGTLDKTALRWSSDVDGDLGTGGLVSANLSQGRHIITLTVTDSDHNKTTVTINVMIGANDVYLPVIIKSR